MSREKSTITVDTSALARWRVKKAEFEIGVGRRVSWQSYFETLIADHKDGLDVPVASMAQDLQPIGDEVVDRVAHRVVELMSKE